MDGAMDWHGLDVISEIYGVNDVEILIAQLTAIRAYQHRQGAS